MNEHSKNPRPNQTAICQNIGGCFQVQGLNQSRIYEIPSFSLMAFSTNKYAIGAYLTYVYSDVDSLKIYGTSGEVYLRNEQFCFEFPH